jgi:hypothetical protein
MIDDSHHHKRQDSLLKKESNHQAAEAKMPLSKKPGWIAWRSCAARAIIMRDLLPCGVLFERDTVSAEDLLPWYKEEYPGPM